MLYLSFALNIFVSPTHLHTHSLYPNYNISHTSSSLSMVDDVMMCADNTQDVSCKCPLMLLRSCPQRNISPREPGPCICTRLRRSRYTQHSPHPPRPRAVNPEHVQDVELLASLKRRSLCLSLTSRSTVKTIE